MGFDFRYLRSLRGVMRPHYTPKLKKRTALLLELKEVFRRYRSQPIDRVISLINPKLQGWVNYFAVGHSSECFSYIKDWVEKKARRHLAQARKRKGFCWKRWNRSWLYEHSQAVQRLSSATRRTESCPSRIGPISLGVKQMGARSAGNPHAACDVEGTGDVARSREAADKAENLAGCKSPYRQLPVFGRLAYPERAEVTKHDVPGRRSPGCPAAVFAAVGTIWGASKLGGRNITKYLQPRNATPREVVIRGQTRKADPTLDMGKADGAVEETGASTRSTAGVWGPASKKRFLELTSGSCRGQQGLVTTCKDSSNEARNRRRREPNGSGA